MQNYTVHATDSSGKEVRRVVAAATMADAERALRAEGLTVRAISADAEDAPPLPASAGMPRPSAGPEEHVWSGGPSQWLNAGWFAACILIIPIPIALWKFIELRNTSFSLSTQRIKIETGVLSKQYDQVELYRVKDTILNRTLIQRMLGLGTIKMITSDPSQPELTLPSIPDADRVRELVRQNVERMRRLRGVRELDVADENTGMALGS
ncbi:MAG: PH domain-containing protein [Phycisphaerae bacterium]|nr:PH domain-containing protein [Phycisphaerae bacterium]MBN8597969.1 PH domain-containing protein [Planctomycetota bacterium]